MPGRLAATGPYAVYLGTRALRRTPWGKQNNWWLHGMESLGIHSDMAIDRYKSRHNLGESSQYDEGPGSQVYFNPFHWHNGPWGLERQRW